MPSQPSGKEHGKLDEGLAGGVTPEKAAQQIIRGLRRNRREILVGSSELLMLKIRKYMPCAVFQNSRQD
ncbi:MAG: hypothetical protein MZV63_54575 [Marinilabiliales bacterium]|nr:hypothetical protein [Marinilabiliales bacterium]